MKKIIALLLALIMTFSVATVAFATEGETTDIATEEKASDQVADFLGEYEWILDLPAGSILPALKVAKIALKFVKVYVKTRVMLMFDPPNNSFLIDSMKKCCDEFEWRMNVAAETPAHVETS